MMWSWIKDKWELLVSAFVVLTVFVISRKKQVAAQKAVETILEAKEKEIEVIEKTTEEERRDKALARKKFSESRLELMQQRAMAISDLEKETIERKLQLIELAKDDPEKIDMILLKEFNVSTLERKAQ
jgi:hypothetical protein